MSPRGVVGKFNPSQNIGRYHFKILILFSGSLKLTGTWLSYLHSIFPGDTTDANVAHSRPTCPGPISGLTAAYGVCDVCFLLSAGTKGLCNHQVSGSSAFNAHYILIIWSNETAKVLLIPHFNALLVLIKHLYIAL